MNVRPMCLLASCSLALAALTASCADSSGDTELFFEPFNTTQAIDTSKPIKIQERYVAYFGSEFGQALTDLNNDGDSSDQVAFVVDMVARTTSSLGTAGLDLTLLGGRLFLVVDEAADEFDWNNDGDGVTVPPSWDDLVLLQCPLASPSKANTQVVATLEFSFVSGMPQPRTRMLATDTRLYFTDDPSNFTQADDTTLNYVTAAAPTSPMRVHNGAAVADTLEPWLMTVDEDLLFLTLDETVEGRNLNGGAPGNDVDMTDAFVLALVDANATVPVVREVGLALSDANSPARALKRAASDWVVGFLVDEASQGVPGGVPDLRNRNNVNNLPINWLPTHCTGGPDVDATDHVLAYLEYATWVTNSVINNTGFAGGPLPVVTVRSDGERVLALKNGSSYYVATIVPEAREGNCTQAGGLNDDSDNDDRVLRWGRVEATFGASGVFRDVDGLLALADTNGGTHGATDLAGRFLAVVDEAEDERDYDGVTGVNGDHTLLGWLDPTDGLAAPWTFDHGTGAGIQAAGTAWIGERLERDYLLVAFQEAVFGAPLNNSDSDMVDSVPTVGRFDPSSADDFDFDVPPAIAVVADNAGMQIQYGTLFYRVDEMADNRDWNGDGVKNDAALFRTALGNANVTNFVSSLNELNAVALFTGPSNIGAAFLFDEAGVGVPGTDLNGDGDAGDQVLRYMRIGP